MQITVNQNPKYINPENFEVPAAKTVAPSFDECKIAEPSEFYTSEGLWCVGDPAAFERLQQLQQKTAVAENVGVVAAPVANFSTVELCQ